jgi:hypothetical protein
MYMRYVNNLHIQNVKSFCKISLIAYVIANFRFCPNIAWILSRDRTFFHFFKKSGWFARESFRVHLYVYKVHVVLGVVRMSFTYNYVK